MKVERKSNFELLRIIAMFFIVLYHVIYHGGIISNCKNEGVKILFQIIEFTIVVHVNIFVLLTGYFQSKNKFNQSKLWSIINASLFYKIIILVLITFLGLESVSNINKIRELSILNIGEYWFLQCYFFLYCLSPFLNKLINNMNKKEFRKLIITTTLIFSILPYITGGEAYSNYGYSLANFIYLYFIGAYLRIYPLKNSYLFKKTSLNLRRLILISIFVFCVILNFLVTNTAYSLIGINSLFDQIGLNLTEFQIAYSNPIIVVQSIVFLLLFESFNIKSKIINSISKLTIGIYIIHDNNFVRNYLYNITNVKGVKITSYSFILYTVGIALLIFLVCAIIEYIRQLIFKFIYNRKLSLKIRESYYHYLNSIYITDENN